MNLRKAIDGTEGYSTQIKLSVHDLDVLRQMVRMQWLYRIQLLVPQHVHEFDQRDMERYHEVSHLLDHATAWPKTARLLPREAIAIIRKMDFFKQIEAELGQFFISDEEHFGWEGVYWRLVRPGHSDVGSLHADKWFWEIGSYGDVANFPHERIKIWIPIYSVPGKNGLLVVPGSHLKHDWRWHAEVRHGANKPIFDDSEENLNLTLLPLAPGEAVMFHDGLIHGGAANLAETTRASLEFTLLVPTKVPASARVVS